MPMRCLFIILFIPALFVRPATAQTFSISLGSSGSVEGAQAIALYGSDILVGGTKNDSAFVVRLSPVGEPLWTKTLALVSPGVTVYVNSLTATQDGYIIGTAFGIASGACIGYYFKLDGTGTPVFVKTNNSNYYFQRIHEKNATQYAVFGAKYLLSSPGTDLKLFTVDKITGNIVSQSDKINVVTGGSFSSTEDFEGSIVLDENTIYATGRFWHSAPAYDNMRPYLVKFNSDEKVCWFKYLHESYLGSVRIYPQGILHQSPDSFYIPYFSDETCSGICSDYVPGLIRTDTSGNVIFDRTYNISSSDGELVRTIVSDGLYCYLIGYTNFNGGNRDIFIIKVDENGNLIKAKKFGSASYDEFFPTNIIGPAACDGAYIYIAASTGSDVSIMKIDTSLFMACNMSDLSCIVQDIVPFSDDLSYSLITETAMVSEATVHASHIPPGQLCDSLGVTDSIYSISSVTLDATVAGADGYFWNTGSTSPVIVVSQSGVYTVTVNDACCSFQNTYVVCIRPAQGVLKDSTVTCEMQQYTFYPAASANNDFSWYINGVYYGSSNSISPLLDSGTHSITLLITNPVCNDSVWSGTETVFVDKTVTGEMQFVIPNVFTPNGDGINDAFINEIEPVENYSIQIYNRWGQELFASTDITNPWDGKFAGNDVPDGMYGYVIHYNRGCENDNAVQL
ncbi:MAG TPA: gliding motility-associated C-terminal domain-containing protein, partial [Flavobacteriales bacterium]|nr:gliding motility-associated C-terminal domain-containing protein [Flavobacteriales bacterium]